MNPITIPFLEFLIYYHVPDVVWRSPAFYVAIGILIIGSIVYKSYGTKTKRLPYPTEKISKTQKKTNKPEPELLYYTEGRSGYLQFRNNETSFSMYWEYGGGNCVVSINVPSIQEWESVTGLPLHRREETLHLIGCRVVKEQTNNGSGHYKIEGNYINIYN